MNKAAPNPHLVMMCIGAPMPQEVLELFKSIEKPEMGKVQWTDPKNWFINFHDFFKMRNDLDMEHFKKSLKKEIFLKYFPLIIELKEILLLPSNQSAKTLECKFDIACIKDPRFDVPRTHEVMKLEMKETIKEACSSVQSIKCDPSLILARIPESEKTNPGLVNLRDLKVPFIHKFYLDKMLIVKAFKDERGLNYEYIEIKE